MAIAHTSVQSAVEWGIGMLIVANKGAARHIGDTRHEWGTHTQGRAPFICARKARPSKYTTSSAPKDSTECYIWGCDYKYHKDNSYFRLPTVRGVAIC
jgi:hypothetical protein